MASGSGLGAAHARGRLGGVLGAPLNAAHAPNAFSEASCDVAGIGGTEEIAEWAGEGLCVRGALVRREGETARDERVERRKLRACFRQRRRTLFEQIGRASRRE